MEGRHGERGEADRFGEAAERAREQLVRRLAAESERVDRELAELSTRMLERARRVAEDRVEREVERLDREATRLASEHRRRLEQLDEESSRRAHGVDERLSRATESLSGEIEVARAQLQHEITAAIETAMSELANRASRGREELAAEFEAAISAAGIASRFEDLEATLTTRFEAERLEEKRRRKAALRSMHAELRDEIARRTKKIRRQLTRSLEQQRDAAQAAGTDPVTEGRGAPERAAAAARTAEGVVEWTRAEVAAAERRLTAAVRAQERELAVRLRAEVETTIVEARAEILILRGEIIRIGADLRAATEAAESRIAETTRLAEATVSARGKTVGAEAINDLTTTANDLSRQIERQAMVLDSRDRLGEVLARLRDAEQRLRDSDERTRSALRNLRSEP